MTLSWTRHIPGLGQDLRAPSSGHVGWPPLPEAARLPRLFSTCSVEGGGGHSANLSPAVRWGSKAHRVLVCTPSSQVGLLPWQPHTHHPTNTNRACQTLTLHPRITSGRQTQTLRLHSTDPTSLWAPILHCHQILQVGLMQVDRGPHFEKRCHGDLTGFQTLELRVPPSSWEPRLHPRP